MIDYDSVLSNPAFSDLEPERVEMIKELLKRLEGKNTFEAMGIITEFSRNIPKGREFGKEERVLMITAVLESMPPDERSRYSAILKMAGMI